MNLTLLITCNHIQSSDRSKGGARDVHLPWGSRFLQFHAVFGKIWQNCMLVPPGELVAPPWGNPGSATAED